VDEKEGKISLVKDNELSSEVLEILAQKNISTTYISCPPNPNTTLGIKLPFIHLLIKNVRNISSVTVFLSFHSLCRWESIFHLKYKLVMIRIYEGDLELLIFKFEKKFRWFSSLFF